MPMNDRTMTQPHAHPGEALRIAVSGPRTAARGLNGRPAGRCAVSRHPGAGHDDVADSNRPGRS